MRSSSRQQPMTVTVGHKSRAPLNPLSETWSLSPALRRQPVSVPDAVERGRQSPRRVLRTAARARGRPGGSRRLMQIRSMEYEEASATATNYVTFLVPERDCYHLL